MTNEKFLVFDTETTNSIIDNDGKLDLTNSIIYDIGFIVADIEGNIYERHSYTVADVFLDKELMASAYFKDKIPQYWEDIKSGSRKLRRLATIRHIIFDVVNQYDIKKVFAYNIKFDYDAFLTTQRYMTSSKYRYYLPYGLEINDIMKLGRELAKTKGYKDFCIDNHYLTSNNRPQTKVETIARFLFDENFTEEHTGLADVEVEYKILCELSKYFDIDTKLWND